MENTLTQFLSQKLNKTQKSKHIKKRGKLKMIKINHQNDFQTSNLIGDIFFTSLIKVGDAKIGKKTYFKILKYMKRVLK